MLKVHKLEITTLRYNKSIRAFGVTSMYLFGLKSVIMVGLHNASFYTPNNYHCLHDVMFESNNEDS